MQIDWYSSFDESVSLDIPAGSIFRCVENVPAFPIAAKK